MSERLAAPTEEPLKVSSETDALADAIRSMDLPDDTDDDFLGRVTVEETKSAPSPTPPPEPPVPAVKAVQTVTRRLLTRSTGGDLDSEAMLPVNAAVLLTLGHLDMACNMVASLARVREAPHTYRLFVTLLLTKGVSDAATAEHTQHVGQRLEEAAQGCCGVEINVRAIRVDTHSVAADWGTPEFVQIVRNKWSAIHWARMQDGDAHFLYLDTDLFFFKDPLMPLLEASRKGDAPPKLVFQDEGSGNPKAVNTGFWFAPSWVAKTPFVRIVLDKAWTEMHVLEAKSRERHRVPNRRFMPFEDQYAFNRAIEKSQWIEGGQVAKLDLALFPTGNHYFDNEHFVQEDAVMVHNNYIRGEGKKTQRFKDNGLWIV
jgi:hypothetical protein